MFLKGGMDVWSTITKTNMTHFWDVWCRGRPLYDKSILQFGLNKYVTNKNFTFVKIKGAKYRPSFLIYGESNILRACVV